MMRSTLLFTFTLFLAACSDNTTNDQTATTDAVAQKSIEKQVTVQTESINTTSEPAPIETEPAVTAKEVAPVNGHTIFAHTCASCHGQNGEKVALNKSQVITGWDTQKTVSALKGYQDGSYGGSMKAIMKGQVSALSDAQIEAVSKYISTL